MKGDGLVLLQGNDTALLIMHVGEYMAFVRFASRKQFLVDT